MKQLDLDFAADRSIRLPDAAELQRMACDLLRRAGCEELAGRLRVVWNPRMRSTAGTANMESCTVTLNPRLKEFGWEEIEKTLRHELAHLVAHRRAGRKRIAPHGVEWKRACHDLGLRDEKRCHNLPLPRRTHQRRHRYRCPHCTTEIARVRPFRFRVACVECCRAHNAGRYDERFRLVRIIETISN